MRPTRRSRWIYISLIALLLITTLLIAACSPTGTGTDAPAAATPAAESHNHDDVDWKTIDAEHKKGIDMFPAETRGRGNQPLPYTLDGDVKVFELVARVIEWETEPGKIVQGWAFNDQIPGPIIRVTEGDRVRVHLTNELPESTAIHWHGQDVTNDQDGVPFITQPPIEPGTTYTYEFTAKPAGTHMYHSHHNAAVQVLRGMLGALIVDPLDPADDFASDHDFVMVLNDGPLGYTINGKGFPATEPLVVNKGDRVRVRFLNEGLQVHPMHLHGMPMTVMTKDGYPLPAPYKVDTLNIAPGERYDVLIQADNPGVWAFHCHVLTHAESSHGMHGMVTVLIVQE